MHTPFDPYLYEVIKKLSETRERVRILLETEDGKYKSVRTGVIQYVYDVEEDGKILLRISARANSYGSYLKVGGSGAYLVKEIVATRGRRRKAGMFYKEFYRQVPYRIDTEGLLDMSATLKHLLAVA